MPTTNNIGNSANIFGVSVVSTTLEEVLTKIDQICHSSLKSQPYFITTVGAEFVVLSQNNPEFRRILNASDLPLAEGQGLKLAAQGLKIVPGRKLVSSLVNKGYRMFFLGGDPEIASRMAHKYGGESDEGEKNIRNSEDEHARIVAKINKYKPDILMVAYGAPAQEKWLWDNREELKVKVMLGVGGAFDYMVGKAKLPPEWINKAGLEWLWRLIQEPWRWRRQLRLVEFLFLVLKGVVKS